MVACQGVSVQFSCRSSARTGSGYAMPPPSTTSADPVT